MLNVFPGPRNASANRVVPLGVDRTRVVYEFFFQDEGSDAKQAAVCDMARQIQDEDITICESVQRGLGSGFFSRGRLFLTHENGTQHFQRLVLGALRNRSAENAD
jgi:choline monooxygenase